jgi:hypothetical protein
MNHERQQVHNEWQYLAGREADTVRGATILVSGICAVVVGRALTAPYKRAPPSLTCHWPPAANVHAGPDHTMIDVSSPTVVVRVLVRAFVVVAVVFRLPVILMLEIAILGGFRRTGTYRQRKAQSHRRSIPHHGILPGDTATWFCAVC